MLIWRFFFLLLLQPSLAWNCRSVLNYAHYIVWYSHETTRTIDFFRELSDNQDSHVHYFSHYLHISFNGSFQHTCANNLYNFHLETNRLKHKYIDNSSLKEGIPEIAGVRIPSPITMQVPTRTRIRSAFFLNAYLSNHLLVFAANDRSWKVERTYVVSSSSVRCWLGIVFIFACRQSNE